MCVCVCVCALETKLFLTSVSSQAELCSLQSRLSQLRIASEKEAEEQRERREEEAEEKNGEAFLEEKRRAEQRLRRIICRCELYVQRHHMLKELGGRGRSLAPGAGQ